MLIRTYVIMHEIFIGTISSVVGAIILLITEKAIVPLFQSKMQKTLKVAGEWKNEEKKENGSTVISTMKIQQFGTNIKAELTRVSESHTRKFRYKGKIYGGQIILTWYEEQAAGFNIGSMFLVPSSDIRELKGKTTFYHHDTNEIISQDRKYTKTGE
jgi:hypothetical protein